MKKRHLYILSITTGILLSAAWPVDGFAPLLFVAFVPLLFLEDYFYENRGKTGKFNVFGYAYISFLIWNVLTTWWVVNASFVGAMMAFLLNTLFMAILFNFFHYTKKKLSPTQGYIALPAYWLAFEYLHLHWDLSWSWLNLGNGFSEYYKMIQWYEFTGTFGGSLWIWVSNILLFLFLKNFFLAKKGWDKFSKWLIISLVLIITLPIIYSFIRYYSYTEKENPSNITVVQPNIDPYREKFGGMTMDLQIKKIIALAKEKTNQNTSYIVAPETAIPQTIWEDDTIRSWCIDSLRKFLKGYPNTKLVIGMSSAKVFKPGEKISATARRFSDADVYYDSYNSALFLDNKGKLDIYHKSKLVPGVELIPFPALFKPLEKLAINLGGTVGSLGVQKERTVFFSEGEDLKVAPVICYESIFGEFVGEYIRKGASFIFIITNDGWWGDTPGYRQHCSYGRLRAIETRRSIARSANTGISCFINQRGDIEQPTKWWVPASINQNININTEITFYTATGDVIAKTASLTAILMVLLTIVRAIIQRKKLAE